MVGSLAMGTDSAALVHQSKAGFKSTDEHYKINNLCLPVTRVAFWGRLLFTPISPSFPFALNRLIKQYKPHILHLHLPNPSAFWALLLPSARRLPWVIHWQSDVLTSKSSRLLKVCYLLYKPFESALLRRAKRIIATSPQYLDTSPALSPFKGSCRVIPLGIADRFGSPKVERLQGKSSDPLRILAIGRLSHYKGFDTLLHAIAETPNTELDLVGSGEAFSLLTSLSRSLGIENRVRFRGLSSDKERDLLLRTCDCLCLPSVDRTESFGIVLLEAMSAGKPCVVSNIRGSGMMSVVVTGQTGFVVAPEDSGSLADAFNQFIENRQLLKEMGERGRARFENQFTIEISTKSVTSLYNELVAVPDTCLQDSS